MLGASLKYYIGGGVKGSELFDSFPNLELDSEDDYNIAGRSS